MKSYNKKDSTAGVVSRKDWFDKTNITLQPALDHIEFSITVGDDNDKDNNGDNSNSKAISP